MEKKKYVRPMVYCESLVLSHHIAACDSMVKLNQANAGSCGGTIVDEKDPDRGGTFFATDGFCKDVTDDQYIEYEGYCYTKQDNIVGFFGS